MNLDELASLIFCLAHGSGHAVCISASCCLAAHAVSS